METTCNRPQLWCKVPVDSKDLNGPFHILDYERQMPLNYSTTSNGLHFGTDRMKQQWGLRDKTQLVVMKPDQEETNTQLAFTQVSIMSLEAHYEISLQSPEQNYF